MRPVSASRRTSTDPQAGFTLVELLVATTMALVLIGGLVSMLSSVVRSQPETAERAAQIREARVVLERMVRELRQGKPIEGSGGTASALTVESYTRSGCGAAPSATAVECEITYQCFPEGSTAACTRRAGAGAPVRMLGGLASPSVFSYGSTTSPTCESNAASTPLFVCLTLTYPGPSGEAVTVEDSAYLRNAGIE